MSPLPIGIEPEEFLLGESQTTLQASNGSETASAAIATTLAIRIKAAVKLLANTLFMTHSLGQRLETLLRNLIETLMLR
jgi:hypothetical protein